MLLEWIFKVVSYCIKNVRIRGFSSPHFPAFEAEYGDLRSPNAGKYEPENYEYGHFLCSV